MFAWIQSLVASLAGMEAHSGGQGAFFLLDLLFLGIAKAVSIPT